MKVYVLSIVFYVASLVTPAFSGNSGHIIYGWEALILGALQLFLIFGGAFSLEFIFLVIPWVANITWLISIVMIKKGKQDSKLAKNCSYFSLFGALVFFINRTGIGVGSLDMTTISPLIGSYLWLFAFILPFLSTYLTDKPNK